MLDRLFATSLLCGAVCLGALSPALTAEEGADSGDISIAGSEPMSPREADLLAAARVASAVYQNHLAALRRDLQSEDPDTRALALRKLGRTHDPKVVPLVTPFLDADVHDTTTVLAAVHAAISLGMVEAEPLLDRLAAKEQLDDEHREIVRRAALNALAQLERLAEHDYKREADTENVQTHAAGVTNLGTLAVTDAGQILADNLRHGSDHVRRMAAIGLGRLGISDFGPQLTDALTDADELVRRYAAEALVRLDYKPAIPYLLLAMEANRAGGDMVRAMRELAGEDFGFNPYDNVVRRREAIERGFVWWEENAKELDP